MIISFSFCTVKLTSFVRTSFRYKSRSLIVQYVLFLHLASVPILFVSLLLYNVKTFSLRYKNRSLIVQYTLFLQLAFVQIPLTLLLFHDHNTTYLIHPVTLKANPPQV